MLGLIVALLALSLLVACIGIAIKGLIWVAVVGLVLFVVTTVFGAVVSARG